MEGAADVGGYWWRGLLMQVVTGGGRCWCRWLLVEGAADVGGYWWRVLLM